MLIEIKKFGTTLTSRDDGHEAFLAIQPVIKDIKSNDNMEVDFVGVNTFSPSWADEFITPLFRKFGDNLILKHSDNPSVKITLDTLETANNIKLNKH